MDKNIWTDIKTIFFKAIELDGKEREKYLDTVCKTPEEKKEILTLIFAHDKSENFLEDSIISYEPIADNSNLFIGKTFGKYKIDKLIARGGMGLVYLGVRDDEVKQKAAVKIINPGVASGTVIKRFQNERQTLANLNHPNISRLLDGGITDDGIQFLVMEYIDGIPIDEYCDNKKLNIKDRLNLFLKVAAVVQYAHQNLVVHRDLKPNNILITKDGEPKLLDFGIAKILSAEGERFETVTQRGAWNLTPEYASPEQIFGNTITTSSDVYSLGIVLYKLLTGHNPYKIQSVFHSDISRIITQSEPAKPSEIIYKTIVNESEEEKSKINPQKISATREGNVDKLYKKLIGDLDNIVSMAIRKEADRRYSSVDHFAEDIKRYLNDKPVLAHQDSFSYRSKKFIKRNKNFLIPAAIIFIVINLAVAGFLWQGYIAAKERDIAKLEADKSNRIKSFLLEMFASPDPNEDGSEVKVIDVITDASQKLSNELKDYPQIEAEIRTMLANTYQNLGVYDSAETELLKSHLITKKVFGNTSVETASSLRSLALIRHYKGDYEKAENYFKEALAMVRSIESTPSFQTALLLDAYATLVSDKGDLEKSEKLSEEAVKIAESIKGSEDPEVATLKNNLATTYNYLKKLDKAEQLYKESLRVFRKHFGNNSLRVTHSLNNLAFIHIYKKDHHKALPLLKEALEIRRRILGDNHPDLILLYSNVGSTYFYLNDFENAEKYIFSSLNIGLMNYDSENISLSRSYMWYGRVLDAKQDYKKSLEYLLKAYKIRKRELGEDKQLTLTVKSLCGQTYFNAGNYAEAEKYLLPSFNSLLKVSGKESEATQKTLTALIELYKKIGRTDKVESYSKFIAEIKD